MEQRCPSYAGHGAPSRTDDRPQLGLARLLVVSVGLATLLAGCVRPYYRKKADEEVADIYREKDKNPEWKLESSHVYPDLRARCADLTNPAYPPTRPDDPAAADVPPNPRNPGHSGDGLVKGTGCLALMTACAHGTRRAAPPRPPRRNRKRRKRETVPPGRKRQRRKAETGPPRQGPLRKNRRATARRGPPATRASSPIRSTRPRGRAPS